jgi:predicted regulator of Ras-like GTPase activity (Roadblock/LC7/MglB family)
VLAENKVRHLAAAVNTFMQALAHLAADLIVGGEGIPVHVDLPADAAVVSAAAGAAMEKRIIVRISVLHGGVLL